MHPADVSGRFTSARNVIFAALCVLYIGTPFVRINGKPAVFFDVVNRRFHLLGATFNSNDFWLVFFLLTGIGFTLIVLTTLYGRVWCGYACPQTVFMEGVFRRIERIIEGPRHERMRRNEAPISVDKVVRKTVKHALFIVACLALAHVFLSYFVSIPSLALMVRESPLVHAEAFGWVFAVSAVMYFDFAWFREQVCLIICPYGRLQSAMTDKDTIIIGYDTTRGEPRGKMTAKDVGDCVDCRRCVQVCPTGIDIRNGLQLDCIGCAACVDACDEVMDKIDRPRGLVRYDSLNGFAGRKKSLLRPRVALYGVLGLIGLAVAGFSVRSRVPFEAHLLRAAGSVFVLEADVVTNPVRLHVVNKRDQPITLDVENHSDAALTSDEPFESISLAPGEARYVPALLRVRRESMRAGARAKFIIRLRGEASEHIEVSVPILGPLGRTDG